MISDFIPLTVLKVHLAKHFNGYFLISTHRKRIKRSSGNPSYLEYIQRTTAHYTHIGSWPW